MAMNTSNLLPVAASSTNPARAKARRVRGFTLLELMAVLAIVGILTGVAFPSMRTLVRSVQLSTASNDLLAGILMARSEAIKRNARVAICKSADGVLCAASGGWHQGWMVFHDANNNGARESGEAIVHRQQALHSDLRVTGNLTVARYVSYAPNGTTMHTSGSFQAGTITVCNQSTEAGAARQIILNSNGRPRVQKTSVGYCG